jgi:hypothetical protein
VSAVVHHVLLALAVAALGGAAFRVASLAARRGLPRVLAAAAFAAAAAVIEALALGTVGLGGSSAALAAAAGLTWLAARALAPEPRLGALEELVGWWRRLAPGERLLLGALGGAGLAWTAWLLRYPAFGYDALLYHLPEAVTWVHEGTPGTSEAVVSGLPVGSYPLAQEVLTSWSMGIARSFVPATLMVPATALLTLAGGWCCLRALRVPRAAAALGVGALLSLPASIAYARTGATVDPAALAWLAACAGLCAASVREPALLAPAIVAGGMAIGTKTTALPLTLVALGLALLAGRRQLRRHRGALAAATLVAAVVGAFWYVRNFAEHGSPFWPFLEGLWGDPQPASVERGAYSFLDRPGDTLSRAGDFYLDQFVGGMLLLGGALLAPLLVRRRPVILAAVATAMSLLLWLNAPLTGVSNNPGFDPGTGDAVRYLLPGLGAAVLTLGLAARAGGAAGGLATAILGLALVAGLYQTFELGFPGAPSPFVVLAGTAAGALVAAVAGRLALGRPAVSRPRPLVAQRLPRPLVGAAAAVIAGCALAPLAPGYPSRHADAELFDSGLVEYFSDRDGDSRPVYFGGAVHAVVSGDRLQRDVALLPADEPCGAVRRRRRSGWVVVQRLGGGRRPARPGACLEPRAADFADEHYLIFAPVRTAGA